MKFLHQTSKCGEHNFNWPKSDDSEEVHESVIFFGPITLDGFSVDFKVQNISAIQSAFAQMKNQQ